MTFVSVPCLPPLPFVLCTALAADHQLTPCQPRGAPPCFPPSLSCRLAAHGGPLAVEFFLIVTGLLSAYQLIPALEGSSSKGGSKASASAGASCRSVVLSYWRRRALRLLPAFAATNLLMLVGLGPSSLEGLPLEAQLGRRFAFGSCPAGIWRNALFLTNLDFSKACGKRLHCTDGALHIELR